MNNSQEKATWVIDIPHPSVLDTLPVNDLIKDFQVEWGLGAPMGVALPVFTHNGPWFESNLFRGRPVVARPAGATMLLTTVARQAIASGLDLYLVVDPTVRWISHNVEVVDIAGQMSAHPCINKQRTRTLLQRLLKEVLEQVQQFIPEGRQCHLVLDIIDLWPMGAEDGRLALTCFCDECKAALQKEQVNIDVFRQHPNPWNLVLEDSGTGIGFIGNITGDFNVPAADEIIQASDQRGFLKIFGRQPRNLGIHAQDLVTYMKARHKITVGAITDLFKGLEGTFNGKRVLLTECMQYDWTGGIYLHQLDTADLCDELWYDFDQPFFETRNVGMLIYMASRARYTIDAFWSLTDNVQDVMMTATTGLGRVRDVERLLKLRQRIALGACETNRLALLTLPLGEAGVRGLVFPAMNEAITNNRIDHLDWPETRAELEQE